MDKSRISKILRIALSISLLFIIFQKIDLQKFLLILRKVDLKFFIFSFFLYIFSQYISTHRWRLLLLAKGIKINFLKLFSFYFVGMFFNLFMPTLVGGDLFRTYDLYRETSDVKESAASILLERLSGLFALVILSLLSLILGFSQIKDEPVVIYSITILSFSFFSLIILIFNENLKNFLSKIFKNIKIWEIIIKFHTTIFEYKRYPLTFLKVILLSFVVQIISLFIFYTMTVALNLNINFIYVWLFTPLITLFSMIPVSLGGWGLRESATIYLYSKIGISSEESLILSLSVSFIFTLASLIGGIILIVRKRL
jgi:uncharacterized protein (TIRG00374 family)